MKMLVVLLIAAIALVFIARDLRRGEPRSAADKWPRFAPFVVFGALSLWIAFRAPKGRHVFSVDFSLVPADIARSMTKLPHLVGTAVLVLLAILAFGPRRLWLAFLATMLLGVGWEIGESTVVGHYARLADLAPNIVGGLVAVAIVAAMRAIIDRSQHVEV